MCKFVALRKKKPTQHLSLLLSALNSHIIHWYVSISLDSTTVVADGYFSEAKSHEVGGLVGGLCSGGPETHTGCQ